VSGPDPGSLDAVDAGAVMADLEQFFDSAAAEAEDFDSGPRPERVVFFMTEIAALAGCGRPVRQKALSILKLAIHRERFGISPWLRSCRVR
jgi:hypothetical protein